MPARARFGVRVGVSEYTYIRGVWKDRQMRYASRFVCVIAHLELVTFLPAVQRDINMEGFRDDSYYVLKPVIRAGAALIETDSFFMIRIVVAKQVSPQFQCQALPLNICVSQVFIQSFSFP